MEDVIEKTTKTMNHAEKDLLTSITLKDPTFQELETKLARFRTASQDLIFLDIVLAHEKNVETRLWDAHGKVNGKFRRALAVFREGEGKKKHVERRKLEKSYLEFVKSSTRFYRAYIQRLACRYADVPEVEDVAHKFKFDTLVADEKVACTGSMRKLILTSCHATLVRLGDLSRYRETELHSKERNWGPAKGYYDLAITVDTTSGMSYNQMAVISLADQNHLRATYYLCRALCVSSPAPTAQGNLDIEFKKILKHQVEKNSSEPANVTTQLLLFYAQCFIDSSTAASSINTNGILSRLKLEIKKQTSDVDWDKVCLINISTEWLAKKRAHDNKKYLRSAQALRQFNIEFFVMLLEGMLVESQGNIANHHVQSSDAEALSTLISHPMRRLLPGLRFYSAWLQAYVSELAVLQSSPGVTLLERLWKIYAEVLSTLINIFPILKLPETNQVLPEDLETMAFLPFSTKIQDRRVQIKTRIESNNAQMSEAYQQEQLLFRIKDFVRDAMYLVHNEKMGNDSKLPLSFAQNKFFYLGLEHTKGIPPRHQSSTLAHDQLSERTVSVPQKSIEVQDDSTSINTSKKPSTTHSINGGKLGKTKMEDMVNDLVDSVMADGHNDSLSRSSKPEQPIATTPVDTTFSKSMNAQPRTGGFNAQDLVRQIQPAPMPSTPGSFQQQSLNHPVLPGIWNTAFTPRPGETPGSSPRQSSARRLTPPYSASGHRLTTNTFNGHTEQQNKEVQMRTSPRQSFGTSSLSYHGTSSALRPTFQAYDEYAQVASPWQSSPVTRANLNEGTEIPRKLPQAALFGAIGEARPGTAKTPTSEQGG